MHEQVMRHLGAQISLLATPSFHTSKHSNQSFSLYNPTPAFEQHRSFQNACAFNTNSSNIDVWPQREDVGRAERQKLLPLPSSDTRVRKQLSPRCVHCTWTPASWPCCIICITNSSSIIAMHNSILLSSSFVSQFTACTLLH